MEQIEAAVSEANEQGRSYTLVDAEMNQGATFKGYDEDGFAVFSVPFSL